MNMIATVAADCAHCAAPLRPGQGRFCCEGCEGAHALVSGLGLDGFYRRREAAAGAWDAARGPAAGPPAGARKEVPATGRCATFRNVSLPPVAER